MKAQRATYQVFDDYNTLTEVSQEELDQAAQERGPLPAHLANAAGRAGRRDLIERLRETLADPMRRRKLAASRALTALGDKGAIPLLQERATQETDDVVARMFRAFALRLEGAEALRRAFDAGDTDPELANIIPSIYSGHFVPTPGDVDFLIAALTTYLDNQAGWIQRRTKEMWQNAVYIIVQALARDATKDLLQRSELADQRDRLRGLLAGMAKSRADRDSKTTATKLLRSL